MDEITLFAVLKPPPDDGAARSRARIRARLDAALAGPGARTGGAGVTAGPGRHRRLIALGIAAVAAACAAIVVPSVLPGGTSTPLVSKAWAVQRNSDGTVTAWVAQLAYDPAGLQRALRAEGVPALVRFSEVSDPGYRLGQPADVPGLCIPPARDLEPMPVLQAVVIPRTAYDGPYQRHEFVIHPSAMPPG
ncbi:MAG: hypothetical protein JO242_18790, partial [Streptosporangiaceae bacterium]|nr:hypothetical protein [Streptosporangiaceae bacterium]